MGQNHIHICGIMEILPLMEIFVLDFIEFGLLMLTDEVSEDIIVEEFILNLDPRKLLLSVISQI